MAAVEVSEPSRTPETAEESKSNRELRPNTVGLAGLVAQSVGTNGPELNALPVAAIIFSFVGALAPVVYMIALLAGLLWGRLVGRFARMLTSAGGCYSMMRLGLSETAASMGGLIYWMGMFIFVPGTAVLGGVALSEFLSNVFPHVGWFAAGHWILFSALIVIVATALVYLGVKISVEALLALSLFGISAISILDIAILVGGGVHGIQWSSLLPWQHNHVPLSKFILALGLGFGAFTCSEAAVYLGEEAKNPKKTVPRAVMIAIVLMLGFLTFNGLALVSGLGAKGIPDFAKLSTAIVIPLSRRYLFAGYADVLLAVVAIASFTSVLGCFNSAARITFDWGRVGYLPRKIGLAHPKHQTPSGAAWSLGVISLLIIAGCAIWQPDNAAGGTIVFGWVLLFGILCLLTSYLFVAMSAIRLAWDLPSAKKVAGFLLPISVIAVMGLCMYSQIHPFPPSPYSSAPIFGIAWVVSSLIVALFWRTRARRRETEIGQA
jgi:amino acid transporter